MHALVDVEQISAHQIVAVIPAYNEERFIGSVVLNALNYADRVIVVDDGSSDRTAPLARSAGADVVQMPQNGGKAAAINAGFQRALEFHPGAVVMLDADAQHDPAEIPQLARPVLEGDADVVIGSRFLDTKSEIPLWRQFGQHALTVATNRTSGVETTDSQSGFRALSVEAVRQMNFRSSGLALESEMQFQLERSALRVTEVPISVQYLDGNKRNPIVHGLQVLDIILSLVARRRPLAFIGIPGIMIALTGVLLGLVVANVASHHHAVPLGTAMISTLLVTIGLLLAMTGVILNTVEHFMTRIDRELHEFAGRALDTQVQGGR